jgi:hypothetical protein
LPTEEYNPQLCPGAETPARERTIYRGRFDGKFSFKSPLKRLISIKYRNSCHLTLIALERKGDNEKEREREQDENIDSTIQSILKVRFSYPGLMRV